MLVSLLFDEDRRLVSFSANIKMTIQLCRPPLQDMEFYER